MPRPPSRTLAIRNPVQTTEYLRNQALSLPLLITASFLLVVGCALRAFPRFYVTG